MISLFRANNGMNIIGQGGKIILFTLPSIVAAILIQRFMPTLASLPSAFDGIQPIGYVLFFFGILLWATGVIQLAQVRQL
ncbi:MAG: hypothetical protein V1799_12730 [bacterium]